MAIAELGARIPPSASYAPDGKATANRSAHLYYCSPRAVDMGLWDRNKAADPPPGSTDVRGDEPDLPPELLWLVDAPMFIDEKQVEAFYDAVLRPDFEGTNVTLSDSVARGSKVVGETTVGAAIPWLAKAEAKVTGERSKTREEGTQQTFAAVSNPYRHLLALAIHYATKQSERLVRRREDATAWRVVLSDGEWAEEELPDEVWSNEDFIQKSPRGMLFLNLPRGTKLIPAALELDDGETVPLFEQLATELQKAGGSAAPAYPGSSAAQPERDAYWRWFAEHFNDRKALDVVEDAVGEGRKIAWIAFRVPLNGDLGPYLHLHVAARGAYETGVFGYNFINRGSKHGLRIVGTLKSEPDLNVLAIFER